MSITDHPIHNFADKPLRNAEDFRILCARGRKACLDLAEALFFASKLTKAQLLKYEKKRAAERMEAAKKEAAASGKKHNKLISVASYTAYTWRVRAVSVVLWRSATWLRTAARGCDKAYRVYLKYYVGDIAEQNGETFGEKQRNQTLVKYTGSRPSASRPSNRPSASRPKATPTPTDQAA